MPTLSPLAPPLTAARAAPADRRPTGGPHLAARDQAGPGQREPSRGSRPFGAGIALVQALHISGPSARRRRPERRGPAAATEPRLVGPCSGPATWTKAPDAHGPAHGPTRRSWTTSLDQRLDQGLDPIGLVQRVDHSRVLGPDERRLAPHRPGGVSAPTSRWSASTVPPVSPAESAPHRGGDAL